jgi:DNA-binding CsgD family transcriptional regulator
MATEGFVARPYRTLPTAGERDALTAVYSRLLEHGSAEAKTLAADIGLEVDAAAQALRELSAMGLTDSDGQTPGAAYAPVDPNMAMLRLSQRQLASARQRADELTDFSRQMEEIVSRFVPLESARLSAVDVELVTDTQRLRQILNEIAETADGEVISMHPGPMPPMASLERGLARNRELLDRGVRICELYLHRYVQMPAIAEHFERLVGLGVEVRLAPLVPLHAVLCDKRLAILPADVADTDAGAIVVRGSALLQSVHSFFLHTWYSARAFRPGGGPATARAGDPTEEQLAVAWMMAAGLKDERIARNLGISGRSLSRLVSEVLQLLGAESRFQAGARAAQLGWLDRSARAASQRTR